MADELIQSLVDDGSISEGEAIGGDADFRFGDKGYWTDADTIRLHDNTKVRLKGYDANEVAKFNRNDEGELEASAGERGGLQQSVKVAELARNHGFTELVDTGETDPFGRKIMDLQNTAGTSLGDYLTETGVVEENRYSSDQALENQAYEKLWRKSQEARGEEGSEFNKAADWIQEFIAEEAPVLKQIAYNEAELGAAKAGGHSKYYIQGDVQSRSRDRKYTNEALNPLSTAWDQGLTGVVEGGYGALELLGHQLGWEGLEDYAEGNKERAQYELGEGPKVITDYKEIEDTGDFFEYVGNLAAMSLPYMALTVGGAALAPVTGGVSLAAPAAVYAGQVWNEMGDTDETEKSATLAVGAGISMAVLDRLGIKGIANSAMMSTAGRNTVVNALVAKGVPAEVAHQQVMNATRLEAAKLTGDAVKFAKDRLAKREVLKNLLRSAGVGTASEGLTEVGQEAIAYMAAVAGSDKQFDEDELIERLTSAAVGGGLLGGAFSIPGTAYNTGAWADVAGRLAPADARLRTLQNQWAADERENSEHGRLPDHKEILAEAQRKVNTNKAKGKFDESVNVRAERAEETRKKRGVRETAGDIFEAIPGLWRGSTRHIFTDKVQERSRTARKLASLFGGQLTQMYGGSTFETAKHLKLAEYKNNLRLPAKIAETFGFKAPTRANLKEISKIVYKAQELADGNWDNLKGTELEQHIDSLKEFDREARRLADKVYDDQVQFNPELGYTENYAYKRRSLDKTKVAKNRSGFEADLKTRFGLSDAQASDITRSILDSDSVTDIDEAFSVLEKGGLKPTSHKQRTLGLSDDAVFRESWLSNDIFQNLSDMAKGAARYTSYQQYLGNDNAVLNNMLNEMQQELIDAGDSEADAKAAVDEIALGMKNYTDAESGNYKRPQTRFGETLQNIQRNFLFVTTLSSLPLATISSFVELALTTKALDQGQIKQLAKIAKEEAPQLFKNFRHDRTADTAGREKLKELGFFEWETGAATVTGATESYQASPTKQQWIDAFFKTIGLKQWTDFTRAMRGSIAADYMMDKINVVARSDLTNQTNEEAEAVDALRNLGINVDDAVELWSQVGPPTPETQQRIEDMVRTATFNFINDAVVLPQTANRPLFYNDPRFALFTQFHGFISAFQANHLPKLYRQAFKGQTPSMKYNAFAVMAGMIMIGFLSQYLKDLLKYGEDARRSDIAGELDQRQWLQRGINSTGLLGVGERALNLIYPIYDARTHGPADWLFETAVGESAAASKAQTLLKGASEVVEGEGVRGTEKLLKGTPLGPFTSSRKATADWLFGE